MAEQARARRAPLWDGRLGTFPARAVGLAVVCWVAVYLAMAVASQWVVYANAEKVLDTRPSVIAGAVSVWGALAIVVATRFAAGTLRRRGVRRTLWLLVLPAAIGGDLLVRGGSALEPLWAFWLLYGLGMGGAIAAVTFWELPTARE